MMKPRPGPPNLLAGEDLQHPMQPIGRDANSAPRFKENKIMRYLMMRSSVDLNELGEMVQHRMISVEDYTQFMQLIGYSVGGYGELSTSPEHLVAAADRLAAELPEGPS